HRGPRASAQSRARHLRRGRVRGAARPRPALQPHARPRLAPPRPRRRAHRGGPPRLGLLRRRPLGPARAGRPRLITAWYFTVERPMPSYKCLLYEVKDPIATLTLNRPERLNALGDTLREDFYDAVLRAGADPEVRVMVITGAGKGLCSGGDAKAMEAAQEARRGQ